MFGEAEGVDAVAEEEEGSFNAIVPELGTVITDYNCGQFCCLDYSADSYNVAIIACVGTRHLVAFPGEVWDKKVKSRKLPKGCLEQAINVRVPGCSAEDRGSPLANCSVNIWIGWLRVGFFSYIDFGIQEEATFPFISRESADQCFPLARAVADAAYERFNLNELLNPTPIENRVSYMEEQLGSLKAGIDELLTAHRHRGVSSGDGGFQSAQEQPQQPRKVTKLHLRPQASKPAEATATGMQAPPGLAHVMEFPGLDPSAVAAARQAGIPDGQLRRMSEVLAQKPSRLEDFPRPLAAEQDALFGDQDLDGEEFDEVAVQQSEDPVSHALVKLTSIVSNLANKKSSTQDDLVYGVASGVSGSGDAGSNLGRKHAVVREGLQKLFRTQPEKIWQAIERNMENEYHLAPSQPGLAGTGFTARGWAEHRSKIQGYARTVRSVWGICGILDAIRSNNIDQARTRCCLMLAAYEQESLDHGSYLLAQEFTLEAPAPLSSFQQHSLPDPMEMASTRLFPQQWTEAFADRLKQVDTYLEMRKKLNVRGKPSGGAAQGDQASGKGKAGKAKGKGKKSEKASEEPTD